METEPHTTARPCKKCGAILVLLENWTEAAKRNNNYLCRLCNAAKGRAFYAANKQRVIDVAKARRHRDPERIREYWRAYRAKNPDAVAGWTERYQDKLYASLEKRARKMFSHFAAKCRYRKLHFDLTEAWFLDRLKAGTCEVTGIKFDLNMPKRAERGCRTPAFAPSIDRIERGGDYTAENCRMVVFIFNVARSDFPDGDLITLARALLA